MPQAPTILRIPQPCAESWAAMIPTGPGRHCAACQKTVVDFTQVADADILAYFRQAGKNKPCGRFRADQLGRPLRPALPTARPPHWQLWLAGLLATALTVQSCQTTPGEVQPAAPRQLAPLMAIPTVDSTTVGDIDTLSANSATVLGAPPLSDKEIINRVLGEPEIK